MTHCADHRLLRDHGALFVRRCLNNEAPPRVARARRGWRHRFRWHFAAPIPVLVFMLILVCPAGKPLAWGLDAPTSEVILTVSGNVSHRNSPAGAQFDRPMLESLGISELRTSTAWTDGVPVFEGVLAARVMEAVGAMGKRVVGRALNDYRASIPLSDFKEFQVLLALKMNGRDLAVREGGPIWIIYPWDQHPDLGTEATKHKSIWQLNELHVE